MDVKPLKRQHYRQEQGVDPPSGGVYQKTGGNIKILIFAGTLRINQAICWGVEQTTPQHSLKALPYKAGFLKPFSGVKLFADPFLKLNFVCG